MNWKICSCVLLLAGQVHGNGLDIVVEFDASSDFSEAQLSHLRPAIERAEKFLELVVRGRAGQDETLVYPITVLAQSSGLAAASVTGSFPGDGFVYGAGGRLWMNPNEVIPSTVGFELPPRSNVLDELMAHEMMHALGLGSLWNANQLTESGSGEYTGTHALAAFREEFDASAEHVPVELAGGSASANVHWNQLFRSAPEEGNPADPLSLSPLIGIVDHRGRDLAQDIMSPAMDPDFGAPFVSNTTIQAFRDLGYDVVESFPLSVCDLDQSGLCDVGDIDGLDAAIRQNAFSATMDLHTDLVLDGKDRSMLIEWLMDIDLGDADLNDSVGFSDFVILSTHFGQLGGWSQGDFDGDGMVAFGDFVLLSNSFGETVGHQATPVPAPSSASAIWLVLLLAHGARSRAKHRRPPSRPAHVPSSNVSASVTSV